MLQRISPRICFNQKLIEFYLSLFLQIHHQNDPNRPRFVAVTTLEDVQAVRCAEFHPNGRVYSVGSNSKTFRICEYPSLSEIRYIHFNGELRKDRTGRFFWYTFGQKWFIRSKKGNQFIHDFYASRRLSHIQHRNTVCQLYAKWEREI